MRSVPFRGALLAALLLAAPLAAASAQAPLPGLLQSALPPDAPPGLVNGGVLQMVLGAHQRLERIRREGTDSGLFIPSPGRIAVELARYRTELRITPAQMPRWNAFADAVQGGADDLRKAVQPADAPGEAPQGSLLMAEFTALRSVFGAAAPLYTSLSPAQKAEVHRLFATAQH